MHVLFVEPAFPRNQRDFVRALRQQGARVTAIGERPFDSFDADLREWLYGYELVPSVVDTGKLYDVVRRVQAREWVDRLEATVEAHVLAAAQVREACTIPGTSPRTAFLCRDKPAMKEVLRESGIPCAESTGAENEAQVREFVARVGLPVILKPRDAAGASGTYLARDEESLSRCLDESGVRRGAPVAVEEFVEGHEGFYDTLSAGGRVVHDFVSHYYPNVLEAMRTRWISPQVVTTNQVEDSRYDEVRALGEKVRRVFGIETSATHMEWFFGPKGLKFSEIGCRPPGVRVWDLYSAANEIDLYDEWAKAIVHGGSDRKASRRYSAGMVALRPSQDGRIHGYEGVETVLERHGEWILDHHFPEVGTPTQPVAGGYMANAWVRARHPDFDTLRGILDDIGRTVRVLAG